mmetsp:Transcript_57608/g.135032  ORF Transcript_57608/g.135032 Transcript_57608/m.135032 type:complete len:273 (+) Transcript_57608:524-1342(+)
MSTPKLIRALAALGFCKSFTNSCSDIMLSPSSSPSFSSNSQRTFRVKSASNCSRSIVETVFTASTRTPKSMFMTVNEPSRMNSRTRIAKNQLSLAISWKNTSWSGKMHLKINVITDEPMLEKKTCSKLEPRLNSMKAMLNTKVMSSRRTKVKKTERQATSIPLTKIINSGMNFTKRAIRAVRRTLKTRAIRNALAVLMALLSCSATALINGKTHVSKFISTTSPKSKAYHGSRRACQVERYVQNRMTSSVVKKKQKNASATTKYRGASVMTV